jgi:hypothetical protein
VATAPHRRTVLVHPGWPKTATTSLQDGLRTYPNVAGAPWVGGSGRTASAVMSQLCYERRWTSSMLEGLLDMSEVRPDLPVVLSDERIIGGAPSHEVGGHVGVAEALRRALLPDEWRVVVLLTIREPRGLLRSNYQHAVRKGSAQSYEGFLEAVAAQRAQGIGPFSVASIVDACCDLVGDDAVCLIAMEEFLRSPIDFWSDVAARLSLGDVGSFVDPAPASRNRTYLGPLRLERALNRRVLSSGYAGGRLRRLKLPRSRWNSIEARLRLRPGAVCTDDVAGLEDDLTASIGSEIERAALRAGRTPDDLRAAWAR